MGDLKNGKSMDVRVRQIYKQYSVGSLINIRTGAQREFWFTSIGNIFKYM